MKTPEMHSLLKDFLGTHTSVKRGESTTPRASHYKQVPDIEGKSETYRIRNFNAGR